MTPAAPLSPRSEPLLWVQLLALAVLPLEALLLLLLLAGSDPGPLAPLERILSWGIGAVAPALFLWRRPADVWSLLLVRTPSQGRRELQRRLSALQERPLLQAMGLSVGGLLSLGLLWWADRHGAVATAFSPIQESPRLIALLLSSALLALMQWQWQQWLQSLCLLICDSGQLQETAPLSASELDRRRFSPGLSLLLPASLVWGVPNGTARRAGVSADRDQTRSQTGSVTGKASDTPQSEVIQQESNTAAGVTLPQPAPSEPRMPAKHAEHDTPADGGPGSAADLPVAIEPEQAGEERNGDQLDQQIG